MSEDVLAGVGAYTAATYIEADDLRAGTALYPYMTVPSSGNGAVSDARLSSMIGSAEQAIDTYCRDHFASSSATYRIQGDGSAYLTLPRRVRSVTAVALVDYAGTSTSFDSTYYRIHTSFDDVTGANFVQSSSDQLELKKQLTVGNAGGNWPLAPWTVEVTGTWDWAAIPEAVKYAACVLVWSWCQSNLPPNVEAIDMGSATIRRPPLAIESTGVFEADRALQPFRNLAFSGRATVV